VPQSCHWYIVINLGGYSGTVRHSMRVLPGLLKLIREAPLSSVPSLFHGRALDSEAGLFDDEREFDVFISHASEDKEDVVRPLAEALR
jgi:hypothetical protein